MIIKLSKAEVSKVKKNIGKIMSKNFEKKSVILPAHLKQAKTIYNTFAKIFPDKSVELKASDREKLFLTALIKGGYPWPLKNPISLRTKNLRDVGSIKGNEWIGGNEFFHHKPKMSQFEKAEKYGGQIRMTLNPKSPKKIKAVKKTVTKKNPRLIKGSKAAKLHMAKIRAKKKK
jgi:hypothetical protein